MKTKDFKQEEICSYASRSSGIRRTLDRTWAVPPSCWTLPAGSSPAHSAFDPAPSRWNLPSIRPGAAGGKGDVTTAGSNVGTDCYLLFNVIQKLMSELNVEECQIQLFWLVERKTDPSLRIVSSFDFDDTPGVIWWNNTPWFLLGQPPASRMKLMRSQSNSSPALTKIWRSASRALGGIKKSWLNIIHFFAVYSWIRTFNFATKIPTPPKKCINQSSWGMPILFLGRDGVFENPIIKIQILWESIKPQTLAYIIRDDCFPRTI